MESVEGDLGRLSEQIEELQVREGPPTHTLSLCLSLTHSLAHLLSLSLSLAHSFTYSLSHSLPALTDHKTEHC